MAGIKEVWVNDRGTWRHVNRFYEKRDEQWVELSADEAVSGINRHRTYIQIAWGIVLVGAFVACVARLLLA